MLWTRGFLEKGRLSQLWFAQLSLSYRPLEQATVFSQSSRFVDFVVSLSSSPFFLPGSSACLSPSLPPSLFFSPALPSFLPSLFYLFSNLLLKEAPNVLATRPLEHGNGPRASLLLECKLHGAVNSTCWLLHKTVQ